MAWPLAPLTAVLLLGLVSAAWGQSLAVKVANHSGLSSCAETDNVTLTFASAVVQRFRIEATHPPYVGALTEDRRAPDWTDCHDLPTMAAAGPPPRRITFYEDAELWLTGYVYDRFWRTGDVPFRVADRVEHGLQLIQLWVRRNERAEEVLVIYPADGYWRLRPLAPAHLGASAYGSSVLIGPVETDGRPFVGLKNIAFDPQIKAFTLAFARGGGATVRLDALDRERLALDVAFDAPIPAVPFAALRSMFVSEDNADVARVAVRESPAGARRTEPVMAFRSAPATDLWAGRLVPSRHNASAPDLTFGPFEAGPAAR